MCNKVDCWFTVVVATTFVLLIRAKCLLTADWLTATIFRILLVIQSARLKWLTAAFKLLRVFGLCLHCQKLFWLTYPFNHLPTHVSFHWQNFNGSLVMAWPFGCRMLSLGERLNMCTRGAELSQWTSWVKLNSWNLKLSYVIPRRTSSACLCFNSFHCSSFECSLVLLDLLLARALFKFLVIKADLSS